MVNQCLCGDLHKITCHVVNETTLLICLSLKTLYTPDNDPFELSFLTEYIAVYSTVSAVCILQIDNDWCCGPESSSGNIQLCFFSTVNTCDIQ